MNDSDLRVEIDRRTGSRQTASGAGHTVLLRRVYPAAIEDVWDACTNPARISRWFLPVTGDLRLGGRYQLQGNAGGEIVACQPPRLLRVTWAMGDRPGDEVEVRLSSDGTGSTTFEIEHTMNDPARWAQFGPGAVGVGWELPLIALAVHLRGEAVDRAASMAWMRTPTARDFFAKSSEAWGAALLASGATAAEAASAVAETTAFYTGQRTVTRDPAGGH